ncbi:MAG: FlgD immunoglobulin-like domain containing protein [bacterium]
MPHHVPSRPIGCVLLLSILAFPGMTRAQCDVSARAGAVVVSGPPVPAVATNTSPFGGFQAIADFGALSASAAVDLPENSSDGGMNAIAEFDDQILITAPGVAQFTPGILTAVIDTQGTPEFVQAATGPGVAQGMSTVYQLFLSRDGGTVYQVSGGRAYNSSQVPPESTTGTVPAPGVVEVDIPFSFGVSFSLSGFLLAFAGGNNIIPVGSTGTISGTSAVTFDWNGMSSIRTSDETEYLGAATVTSCSGFDWKGNVAPTAVAELDVSEPGARLEAAFPNPFRHRTNVAFSVATAGPISLAVFDVGGRRVQTLVSEFRSVGRHTIAWDGVDDAGRSLPGGVYFVRLVGGDRVDQEKIVFLK